MNWLHYLLEANLYLAVFYAGYYLFLRRETYYTLNRIYLLFSCIASFALPIMQLGVLKPVERPITTVQFAFPTQTAATTFIPVHVAPTAPVFTWQDGVVDVYLFGAAVLLVVLLVKLYQLLKLTRAKNMGADGSYKVVQINGSDTAFSFFNYLFIGTKVQQAEMIIKHELVHIKQKHSADIIFIELLKIVNWFNPFIYLLQYSLREIHEYIADEKIATSGTDALTYSSFLVSNAYGLSGSSITHSFFNYNLLKKRIIMLHQKRSGSLARLRYLLAIPICGGLLCVSTLAFSKTYGWVDIAPHRINPANTSPQVKEQAKHLLISEKNGARIIARNFYLTRSDGTTKDITAYNLSNKDRVDFKKQGYTVDIVSATDTDKTRIAPPPPAPPVKQVKFPPPIVRPSTPKGYPYSEVGHMENGRSDIKVTIYEKNGSHKVFTKSKATPEEIALLKDKYGYEFPAHLPPPPPEPAKPRAIKFPPPVIRPDHKVPPPPPVVVPDGKTPPPPSPVVVPDGKTPIVVPDGKTPPPPPAPPVSAQIHKMPPPPPLDRCFFSLYDYMAKTLKYPADPKKNRIVGNVVVSFKLDADHKITDVKLVDAGRNGFDEEVINALKSCTMPIVGATPRPYYMLGVSFNLVGDNTNFLAKPFGPDITNTENYACVVQLNGYTNN